MLNQLTFEIAGNPVTIFPYSLLTAIGGVFLFLTTERIYKKDKLTKPSIEYLYYMLLAVALLGFAGGSFFFQIFSNGAVPLTSITVMPAFFSAFCCALILCFLFKVKVFLFMETVIPGLVLAHAAGRIGCFLGGCCYGLPTNLPWAVSFPKDSLPWNHFHDQALHPVQLYESLYLTLLALFLIYLIKPGSRFVSYLFAYGFFRFMIEELRADYRGNILGSEYLSPSQYFSLIYASIGILWFFLFKNEIRNSNGTYSYR